MLIEAVLAASAMLFAGEIPSPTKSEPLKLHAVEEEIIRFTNLERARYGLPPLELDEQLVRSARRHATWMTSRLIFRHTNAPVSENIAMGQANAQEAVRDWMHSPGHRANILGRGHRRIGAAAYVARNGRIYWCQQFLR